MMELDERLDAQLYQRYTSEVLWHFVGRKCHDKPNECFEILCSILKDGLKVGGGSDQFIYEENNQKTIFEGWPICCLADIPFKDLHIHAYRYGTLAIGFYKTNAIKKGFNPVLYVHHDNPIFKYFMERRNFLEKYFLDKGLGQTEASQKLDEIMYVLQCVTKRCDLISELKNSQEIDAEQKNNFYYEREWRSIWGWEFSSQDVAAIIVNDDEQVNLLREKVSTKGLRANKNVPILPFRIVYRL